MRVEEAGDQRPASGVIRIQVDQELKRTGLLIDVRCQQSETLFVQLEECPVTRQQEITLLERAEGRLDDEGRVVRQLYTYDLERALMMVEHLRANDDPRSFCQHLAVAFSVNEPGARIPLDVDPRDTETKQAGPSMTTACTKSAPHTA